MIDFTSVLFDFDGVALVDPTVQADKKQLLTLGRAASHALCASYSDEQNLSGDEKFRRGMLAYEIRENKSAELKAEDIATIKNLISKMFGAAVVFRAWPMLDPAGFKTPK